MSDIFISYASEDKEKAGLLSKVLEEQGWSVWWDRKIPPGRTFDEVIEEALDAAKCVVVLWSKASVKSDWVKEEASEGNRRKILVPGVIEDVNIPLGFRRIQAAQLIDWNGEKSYQEINQLIDSVEKVLGIPRKVQSKTERDDPKKEEASKGEKKRRMVVDGKVDLQQYAEEKIKTKPVTIEKTETKSNVQIPLKGKSEEEMRRKPEEQQSNATSGTVKKNKLVWLIPSIIVPLISVIVVFSLFNQKGPVKNVKETIVVETGPTEEEITTDVASEIIEVNKDMVFVKGGCFEMGDIPGDGNTNEKPVHQACVKDFYMGKYEVTQGQWKTVMGNNPSNYKQGDNYPVESVSWEDVQTFIEKLNQETGRNYRLPTEAEWEYAARAGITTRWYCGDNEECLDSVAWYLANSENKTHPVGTKQPNNWGLYDMSGNVWEWCQDWYSSSYYTSPETNPTRPETGPGRVVRGGSWSDYARLCRSSNRRSFGPSDVDFNLGFRLVLPQAIR